MGEGNENLVYLSPWDFKSSFTCRKILRRGTFRLHFPSERKVCCGFLLPLKIHRLARFESTTFGYSGKHTNHYITKATELSSYCSLIVSHCNNLEGPVRCALLRFFQMVLRFEISYYIIGRSSCLYYLFTL
jgi:hypothetical protein